MQKFLITVIPRVCVAELETKTLSKDVTWLTGEPATATSTAAVERTDQAAASLAEARAELAEQPAG